MRSSKLKTWSDENGTYITVNGITRQLANFRAKVVQEVTEFGLDGETRRYFTLRVQMQDQRFEFEISHLQFEEMAWIRQYLGLDAWIDSERSTKATLLAAIVKASKKRQRISKVKRLGYQKHGDDLYFVFHNGAISAKGHVNTSLIADVDGALKNCYFPPLNDNDDLPELVNKILNIAKIMPRNLFVGTILLAAVFRAILNKFRIAEVTIYILGESGCGKTTVSLVAQSSFGPGFKKPPASWKSTPKSVELSALAASCISLLIDDFTKVQDDKSAIPVIENIIGAVGDGAPRGFALSSIQNSDGAAIEALPIMTGEHIPDVMIDSRKARTCFCLIPTKDDFDKSVVGGYQKDAAAGVYAKVIGAYIQYILQNYQRIESEIEAIFDRYRSDAMSIVDEGLHSRAPSNYADLMLGFHYFLKFCINSNCLTKQQATEIRKYHSDNLLQLINMQPIIHNTQNINHLVAPEKSRNFSEATPLMRTIKMVRMRMRPKTETAVAKHEAKKSSTA